MASSLCLLLSLVLAVTTAAPVPSDDDGEITTVASNVVVPLLEVVDVIDNVPVLVPVLLDTEEATTEVDKDKETKEPEHKVAKRSLLSGDNPSNDLLTDLEAQQYENGLSNLAGRRIKFLPTFLG